MKRTDIILTVETPALALFAEVALAARGTLEGFLS